MYRFLLIVLSKHFGTGMWPDQQDTEQLLTAARTGDGDAVNQLLDRHRVAIRRMIDLRMDHVIKRRVDASDIVQEVLIEANRRLSEYLQNPVMPFHLWLRQMAKDRLIDAHRRHRGASRRSMDREQPLVAATANESSLDLLAQIRDAELTPAAAATWHELQNRFQLACEKLDDHDQEIVLLRHFEHLSNSEAADVLELSPQAASMRYLRAMRRLRQFMDGTNTDHSAEQS